MFRTRMYLMIIASLLFFFGYGLAQSETNVDGKSATPETAADKAAADKAAADKAAADKAAAAKAAASAATAYKRKSAVDTTASDAALEELRYKHLWIAYGLIWLIIFIFMLRTYRVGRENRETLDALKSRLLQLEQKDG